jgi:hypothetical protein
MGKLLRTQFRTHSAAQFKESLTEASNSIYYVVQGKPVPPNGVTAPDAALTNSQFQTWDEMVLGKHVTNDDAVHMVKKIEWANNTSYISYDDQTDLPNTDYFVVTSEGSNYNVWKCLANNQSSGNSTSKPLYSDVSSSLNTLYLKTADGYQWRFMYSITDSNYTKFATSGHIPVYPHANASGNAVAGSIDAYVVTNSGNNYNEFSNGSFVSVTNSTVATVNSSAFTMSSNDDFYNNCGIYIASGTGSGQLRKITDFAVSGSTRTVTIGTAWDTNPSTADSVWEITPYVTVAGDGSGATARAMINTSSNTIANVEVITRGSGYSYAVSTVEANNMAAANVAAARGIISPPHGHANNVIYELDAYSIGISVNFANNEASEIPTDNSFSQIGLVKDVLYANVQLNGNTSGTLTIGEKLTQANTGAYGYIIAGNTSQILVGNVYGAFVVGNSTNFANVSGANSGATMNVQSFFVNTSEGVRNSFSTFDQRTIFDHNRTSANEFTEDEKATQADTDANAYVHFSNSSIMAVTNVRGTFNLGMDNVVTGATSTATSRITAQTNPDLVKNSGEVLYLEEIDAVSRSNTTTETVRLVITF